MKKNITINLFGSLYAIDEAKYLFPLTVSD